MQSKKYAHMSSPELDVEIQKMRRKVDEIKSDISILESLKLANEVREKRKNGNQQNQNFNNQNNG